MVMLQREFTRLVDTLYLFLNLLNILIPFVYIYDLSEVILSDQIFIL